jgi:hypothetical protein
MDLSQLFGLAGAVVGLAIVAVVIVNGTKTAQVVTASGNAFSQSITAATHPSGGPSK